PLEDIYSMFDVDSVLAEQKKTFTELREHVRRAREEAIDNEEKYLALTKEMLKYDEQLRIYEWIEELEQKGSEDMEIIKKALAYNILQEKAQQQTPTDVVIVSSEGDKEKVDVNYEALTEYLALKYSVIVFRGVFYVYRGGKYVENMKVIERDIVRLVTDFWPDAPKRRLNGIVDEVMKRLEWLYTIETRIFPFNPYAGQYVPLKNGVYDINNDVLLPHSPFWMWTYMIPHEYDPNAECPNIINAIHDWVGEDNAPLLYEIPALCLLYDESYQRAYMLVGDGANGKSTYLNLIRELLGPENVTQIKLQDLCSDRFKTAELSGKLANIFPDIPKNPLKDVGNFKALTGGDAITVERKFKDPFDMKFRGRLIFSANELPDVREDTYAFWRRWVIIEFPNTYPPDSTLFDRLKKEIPGFLKIVLKTMKWIRENGLIETHNIEKMMDMWKRRSSSVYAFVQDMCVVSQDAEIPKDELYSAYVDYCDENDFDAVKKNSFGMQLPSYARVRSVQKRIGGRRIRVWQGIRLKNEEDREEDSPLFNSSAGGEG
ncbi:MAG: hypothetical protein J7J44_07060, partial [Deltaproteobacteria bacterium]|nr:hypothetical protein [Deltaproteobacteria bacterium]